MTDQTPAQFAAIALREAIAGAEPIYRRALADLARADQATALQAAGACAIALRYRDQAAPHREAGDPLADDHVAAALCSAVQLSLTIIGAGAGLDQASLLLSAEELDRLAELPPYAAWQRAASGL